MGAEEVARQFAVAEKPEHTISVRLLLPFVRWLSQHPRVRDELAVYTSMDPDDRVPLKPAFEALGDAIRVTGECAVGLKVGRDLHRGEVGALDYAMFTAPNLRQGLAIAERYFRVVNDAITVRLECRDDSALVRFDSRSRFSKVSVDFLLAGLFTTHFKRQLADLERLEVWCAHPAPAYAEEYERTFAPAVVRFDAPCYGFRMPSEELDRPLIQADQHLHHIVRKHMDQVLGAMEPTYHTFADQVSTLIARELGQSSPVTAVGVARTLRVSARTLARRLEAEGTTFSDLLDGLRHRLAVEYMGRSNLSQSEVAFLLGFSHVAAFHRAFKRWTGQTPRKFRLQERQEAAELSVASQPVAVEPHESVPPPLAAER